MPTITAGTVATVYCPLAGSITITPGSAGRVSFQSRTAWGAQSAAPRDIYTAETLTIQAGDTVTMEAINTDATYTDPAGRDGSLQALVSAPWILNGASAGQDSGWIPYVAGMRLAYALDSGTTATTFSVDISADGSTSLGQAFTGTYASSTVYEVTPPIWLSNQAARYIRFNVLTGGPLSVRSNV